MEHPGEHIEVPQRDGLPSDRRIEDLRPPPVPAVLAVNAKARSARGRTRELVRLLEREGVPLEAVLAPKRPQELPGLVRSAVAQGARRVLVAGGDGTVSCAARALVDTDVVVGVLPLGTANDFARTLGIPSDLGGAVRVIAHGQVARIDVGTANGVPFLNAASLGLTSALTRRMTAQLKKRWGKLAYPLLALATARDFHPFELAVDLEGTVIGPEQGPGQSGAGVEVLAFEALQVVVGNGRFHGGGQMVAPEATLEDGRLDFYAVAAGSEPGGDVGGPRVRRWRDLWLLTRVATRLRSGRQIEHPWVVHRRVTSVTVRTAPPLEVNLDGELTGHSPVTFAVRPASLSVMVPPVRPQRAAGRPGTR